MSRVEDLEARVAELSAELDGLLDEYMDTRRRLHELEASHDADAVDPDPYSLGDDPHAVVVDRSRTATGAVGGRGDTLSPTVDPEETEAAFPNDDSATNEASQEEVDQAVRRIEGDTGAGEGEADAGDVDADAGDDGDTSSSAPEQLADDIIVG